MREILIDLKCAHNVANDLFVKLKSSVDGEGHLILKKIYIEYAFELFKFGPEYDVYYKNCKYSNKKSLFLKCDKSEELISSILSGENLLEFQKWLEFGRI